MGTQVQPNVVQNNQPSEGYLHDCWVVPRSRTYRNIVPSSPASTKGTIENAWGCSAVVAKKIIYIYNFFARLLLGGKPVDGCESHNEKEQECHSCF